MEEISPERKWIRRNNESLDDFLQKRLSWENNPPCAWAKASFCKGISADIIL